MAITSLSQLDLNKTYTYAEYLTWQFDQFVELIRGKVFPMSAPKRKHQDVSSYLHTELGLFMRNSRVSVCKLYAAPFDVRLLKNPEGATEREIYSVVQPDLCIVCDLAKLDERGCVGAPDFIVEILSPGTKKKDLQDKFNLYEENGVQEYWIVSPDEKIVQRFFLEQDRYQFKGFFLEEDTISSLLFPDLVIDLAKVFADLDLPSSSPTLT